MTDLAHTITICGRCGTADPTDSHTCRPDPPSGVCEPHPWLLWPHDDCPGPGAPSRHGRDLLAAAIRHLATTAPAVPANRGWLTRHPDLDPDLLMGAGWTYDGGHF